MSFSLQLPLITTRNSLFQDSQHSSRIKHGEKKLLLPNEKSPDVQSFWLPGAHVHTSKHTCKPCCQRIDTCILSITHLPYFQIGHSNLINKITLSVRNLERQMPQIVFSLFRPRSEATPLHAAKIRPCRKPTTQPGGT